MGGLLVALCIARSESLAVLLSDSAEDERTEMRRAGPKPENSLAPPEVLRVRRGWSDIAVDSRSED